MWTVSDHEEAFKVSRNVKYSFAHSGTIFHRLRKKSTRNRNVSQCVASVKLSPKVGVCFQVCVCVCVRVFMCGCCFRSQRDCHTKLNRTKKSITWMWCRSFCFYIDFFANCKSYLLCVSCCLNWINAFFLFVCLSVVNNYSYYVIFYFLFSLTSTSVVFCMV